MTRRNIYKVVATLLITNVFCLLWQWLEVLIYGAIEGRIVDDIMMWLMIPFFYCTISFILEKVDEKKRANESDVNINIVVGAKSNSEPHSDSYERD